MTTNLDPHPYTCEHGPYEARYGSGAACRDDKLDPRPGYSQDEADYR